jgi:hypothetical protein
VAAALRILPPLARSDVEAKMLATALAAPLAIVDSDRNFTSALRNGELVSLALKANTTLRRDGSSDMPMLAALRRYLVRHLSAVRCKDTLDGKLEGVERFNAAVRGRADVAVLTSDETKAAGVEGEAPRRESANEAEYQERLREVQQLRRAKRGENLAAARLTPEWTYRALQALSRIQDWKGTPGQDPVELFHQKATLLWRLLDVVPASRTFDTVLNEMVRLLEDESILRRSPAEWIAELRRLQMYQRIFTPEALQALRSSTTKIEGLPYESGLEISEAFSRSRLSALSLYGRIALLDRKPKSRD